MIDLLVTNTSEVLTAVGSPDQPAETALASIPDGVVAVSEGRVLFVGPRVDLPASLASAREVIDARRGFVSPGLVDPHTHVVFAGDRSSEFEARAKGATYLEIAAAGGGIMSTVRATRAASLDELCALALPRLQRLAAQGITTVEVKSGYGLSVEDELKMLEAINRLQTQQPLTLVPTLLCGHAVPQEFAHRRGDYLRLCVEELVPEVARRGLARFCDVFVEQGALTLDEGRALLVAGKNAGLLPRLHADQLTATGAALLAAELGATSADHLEQVTPAGIEALGLSRTAAVLAPVSTLSLRVRPYAPGRLLRDRGINVALCTNFNPGSSMCDSVSLTMALACLENGLTPAEALYGFTRGAALALGLPQAGQLSPTGPADLVVHHCPSYRHLPYHLAGSHARMVVKAGRVIASHALGCG